MMFALAREIPAADASTQAGKWEKNRFMGVELTAKTLGVIGCGNIGSIVADRALGLKMKVIAFDPFLSPERALDLGVEKVELDELLARADVITLHTPLTEKTKNVLSAEAIAKTKKGVRIVNCARGGLVDEAALAEALQSGQVGGAAFDVFITEPATENPLFGLPNVICTPHLGASTTEAQENVALQVAEQMSDYLLRGAISNAVNFPSITAEEAPKLKPFIELAEKLGSFAGQLTDTDIKTVRITYDGAVASLKIKALTSAAVAGLLRPALQDVNVVSAPSVAKERGIVVEETTREVAGDYESLVTLDRRHRQDGAFGLRHGVRRRAAAHRRHQGHQGGRGVRAVHALRDQRGQARLRRPLRRRCLATLGSTSPPSRSAGTGRAATPSRWSRSTARCRPSCSTRCSRSPRSSRPSRWCFEAADGNGRQSPASRPGFFFAHPKSDVVGITTMSRTQMR